MNRAETRSSRLRLILSWLVVALPLAWGVVQSVGKSLPLFLPD